MKAKDFDRALAARGTEFIEYFEAFDSVSVLSDPTARLPKDQVRRLSLI